jgi:hypothetical protein
MPCNDVTELLALRVDGEDRLVDYKLLKRSCGRAVGESSLLLEEWRGLSVTELLAFDSDVVVQEDAAELETFLRLKHFFAVQGALRVLLGDEPGGAMNPVRVAQLAGEGDHLLLTAELAVDVLVEKIEACGNCRGCAIKHPKHAAH